LKSLCYDARSEKHQITNVVNYIIIKLDNVTSTKPSLVQSFEFNDCA